MALGDGFRRNIAKVDPSERALLRDAFLELNRRFFPGARTDTIPGHVSWWFKQDEIHQATHVHGGTEFVPWHREIVNRLEAMLRQINPQLSLHYWDWTQDPRQIPNANLGGGSKGTLNLFKPEFMGYGGPTSAVIGPPWQNATAPWRGDGFYVPGANPHRDSSNNPADPPTAVNRSVGSGWPSPASAAGDAAILNAKDFASMRALLEDVHDNMHGFIFMGGPHISFRDPFVFLLHSNMDRLFARWQTDPAHPGRLVPSKVYGSESGDAGLNSNIQPWSGTPPTTRPWAPPENEQVRKTYKHQSVVTPPLYDTNHVGGIFKIAANWHNMPAGFGGPFDTALNGGGPFSGKCYFFRGDKYVRYDWSTDRADSGYPKIIKDNWNNLPAGFTSKFDCSVNGGGSFKGKCYFFKGDKYIRYDWASDKVDSGYPKTIADNWHNLPIGFKDNFDAMMNGRGPWAGKLYIFKGNQYVRYDWQTDRVDPGYPRRIADNWHRLPSGFTINLDAALEGDKGFSGKGYLFNGDSYVRYNWAGDFAEG